MLRRIAPAVRWMRTANPLPSLANMHRLRTTLAAALVALLPLLASSDATAQRPSHIRVMTYNIHHGEAEGGGLDLSAIAGVIRDHGIDVVGLQEVDRHWSQRSDFADQASELAAELGMDYFFAPIYDLPPAEDGQPRREYGLAILSRFPITDATNHALTRLPTAPPGDTVRREMPGFPGVTLDIRGVPLRFFNTHLDYRPDPAVREIQVRETVRILESLDGPIILLGDLNASPGSPELLPLLRIFRDAWEVGGVGDGYTFPAIVADRRIDYILTTPDIEVAAVRVPVTAASDHRPVVADLLIPNRTADAAPTDPEDWVEARLAELALEQRVAQLFSVWAGGPFQSADDPYFLQLVDLVERFEIGGLLFGVGEPMEQVALVNELQSCAAIPLLVSQDMEWGAGMRLARATTLPRAMALGATRQPGLAYQAGYVTGVEARALGVHQILAPVADVNNNPANPVINTRSFGEDPELVAGMTAAFVRGAQDAGVIATVKHFPGHGDTDADSHLSLPVLRIDRARLDSLELVPFRAALDAGVRSVMTGHLAIPALEPDTTVGATLSARVTRQILRDDLGFDGLIVSDAMTMQGIGAHFDAGEAAVRAVEAGVDMMLRSPDYDAAHAAVVRAVAEGRLTRLQIEESARRVLRAKADAGLMHRARGYTDPRVARRDVATRQHLALADAMTRASLTLLRNEQGLLPLAASESLRLLVVTLDDDSDPAATAAFAEAVRQAAPASEPTFARIDALSDTATISQLHATAGEHDLVLVPAFVRVRSRSGQIRMADELAAFLDELIGGPTPVALVTFGNPYMVGELASLPDAYLVAYSADATAQEAAADAIFGRTGTPGALPVSIPGLYAYGDGIHLQPADPE